MLTARLIHSVAASTLQRDRDQLEKAIAHLILQFLQARSVTVAYFSEEEGKRQIIRRTVAADDLPEHVPIPFSEALWNECIQANAFMEGVTPEGELVTVFPLHVRADVRRVVQVHTTESLAIPQLDIVYGVLRIIENHLALLDYGERDTLTGLLNRKTFESRFNKVKSEPGAAAEPTWLALVDIDHFKVINDTQGHLFGDEVLLLVSQLMKRNFRGADQLFRFGGEEFLIILGETSEQGVQIALERLRIAIAEFKFPQLGTVTISLGYTRVLPSDVATTCVERADEALYYAKNHGRNNVQYYESLVASGALVPKNESGEVDLF
jgi:diguanylate cyclase (GGDEF)-like protein